MWDAKGWKRLTVHDNAPLPAARNEFLAWLEEVPLAHHASWRSRLTSDLDVPHLSVRLELFLHHYLKQTCWDIDIEPELTDNPNRPDFIVAKEGKQLIMIEARAVFSEHELVQQNQRLAQLGDQLGGKLSGSVIIHPLSDLPPNIPVRRIRYQIETRLSPVPQKVTEFDVSNTHQGIQYTLGVVFVPDAEAEEAADFHGVEGMISQANVVSNNRRVRDALGEKAGKYGELDCPYVIALSGETWSPLNTEAEYDALFGDRVWTIQTTGGGEVVESRRLNRFFTSTRKGSRRHQQVSAVLFYRFRWLADSHSHQMHIYHNPFASFPLALCTFPGVPQLILPGVPQLILHDLSQAMLWVNGEPD